MISERESVCVNRCDLALLFLLSKRQEFHTRHLASQPATLFLGTSLPR